MTAGTTFRAKRPKRAKLCLWNKFVLAVGYASLLYALARGIVYVLVLLGGAA